MTSTNSLVPVSEPTALIKTDILGRAKRTAQQREQILDDYERSGISGREFSRICGVKYQTFATWAQKRKRQRGQYPKPPPEGKAESKVRWLEASVQRASA